MDRMPNLAPAFVGIVCAGAYKFIVGLLASNLKKIDRADRNQLQLVG